VDGDPDLAGVVCVLVLVRACVHVCVCVQAPARPRHTIPPSSLARDFECLLDSEIGADVTFVVSCFFYDASAAASATP